MNEHRRIVAAAAVMILLLGAPSQGQDLGLMPALADSVLVVKSERKLYLLKAGRILRAFDVALGLVPNGPKRR